MINSEFYKKGLVIATVIILAYVVSFDTLKTLRAGDIYSTYSENVRENYLNYCAGCHGQNLEKFNKSDWMFGDSDEAAFKSIKYGQEEMGMPAFEVTFSDNEIAALAKYIRTAVPKENLGKQAALTPDRIVESKRQKFIIDTVVTGLNVPWGLEFLPDGDLLIAERAGILYRFNGERLQVITGLPPILAKGQGGLMDLRLHPDYKNNGWLYFSYSEPSEKDPQEGCTSIMRARLNGNMLVDKEKIFDGEPESGRGQHWG
jgi:aldose sugar dehydrogenase